jgi:hypothetical protein
MFEFTGRLAEGDCLSGSGLPSIMRTTIMDMWSGTEAKQQHSFQTAHDMPSSICDT